jgi:pyruvate/2-oxoglutarate dehydrogenase complex dihydrolipoamide acyltransferase (E2) component
VWDREGGERVELREVLSLTISLDHDLIDGAPAARFVSHFKEIIESGAVLARNREETHKDTVLAR